MKNEEALEKLEAMGIETAETLQLSIMASGRKLPQSLARFMLVGDAIAQLSEKPDATPLSWDESALSFVKKGISIGRVSHSLVRLSLLQPRSQNRGMQLLGEARQELFAANPHYHGRRSGIEYAKAVASGRLKT